LQPALKKTGSSSKGYFLFSTLSKFHFNYFEKVKLNEEKFGRLKLPLTFATRFKKAKVLQRLVVKISKQNRFFLLLKSIKKVEIKRRKIWQIKIAAYLCNPL
jgi:hypothetical protein